MPTRWLVLGALGLLCLLSLSATSHAAAPLIAKRQLRATTEPRSWESRPLPENLIVYVRIFRGVREIAQTWINSCQATYADRDLYIRLTIRGCKQAQYRVRLRYISLAGAEPFRVRLSRSNR